MTSPKLSSQYKPNSRSYIDYTWSTGLPSNAGSYVTRKAESKVRTVRYFDGTKWFDVRLNHYVRLNHGGRDEARHPMQFTLPYKDRSLYPQWMRERYDDWVKDQKGPPTGIGGGGLVLRTISDQTNIQYGQPFRVFSDKDVLKWMIDSGQLRHDWNKFHQAEMQVVWPAPGQRKKP